MKIENTGTVPLELIAAGGDRINGVSRAIHVPAGATVDDEFDPEHYLFKTYVDLGLIKVVDDDPEPPRKKR
jgi:hypothetical protein